MGLVAPGFFPEDYLDQKRFWRVVLLAYSKLGKRNSTDRNSAEIPPEFRGGQYRNWNSAEFLSHNISVTNRLSRMV
jgi:hypothetical protein